MSQTMLLTKRLCTFLNNNTTPQLHTLLILGPTGKLLSSSSPLPASTLRTQATLACSIWNLYNPFQSAISDLVCSALSDGDSSSSLTEASSTIKDGGNEISSIMIQLEYGIMVIRSLHCGLIFVAIGPSSSPPPTANSQQQKSSQRLPLPSHSSPSSSPPLQPDNVESHERNIPAQLLLTGLNTRGGGSTAPSEAGSVGTNTSAGATVSILGLKKQAEELASCLDEKLEGLVLRPDIR